MLGPSWTLPLFPPHAFDTAPPRLTMTAMETEARTALTDAGVS